MSKKQPECPSCFEKEPVPRDKCIIAGSLIANATPGLKDETGGKKLSQEQLNELSARTTKFHSDGNCLLPEEDLLDVMQKNGYPIG